MPYSGALGIAIYEHKGCRRIRRIVQKYEIISTQTFMEFQKNHFSIDGKAQWLPLPNYVNKMIAGVMRQKVRRIRFGLKLKF